MKSQKKKEKEKAQGGPLISLNAYYAALPAALYMYNTRSRDVNHCGNCTSRNEFFSPVCRALVALDNCIQG